MSFQKTPYQPINNETSILRVTACNELAFDSNERKLPNNHVNRAPRNCPAFTNTLFLGYRILFACKPKNPV